MARKWPKWPKNGPKRPQNEVKTTPKWHRNDAKTMPRWWQHDPKVALKTLQKWSNITQKWPILTHFWSILGLFWAILDPFWPPKEPKTVKMMRNNVNTTQKSSRPSKKCITHSKSSQDTSRHTHLLHIFIGWNASSDRLLSKTSVL